MGPRVMGRAASSRLGLGQVALVGIGEQPLWTEGHEHRHQHHETAVHRELRAEEGEQQGYQGEGEDDFVFNLSREEFLDVFFDDLALPDLVRTQLARITEYKSQRAGFSSDGTPNNLHVVRSLRGAIGRKRMRGGVPRGLCASTERPCNWATAKPSGCASSSSAYCAAAGSATAAGACAVAVPPSNNVAALGTSVIQAGRLDGMGASEDGFLQTLRRIVDTGETSDGVAATIGFDLALGSNPEFTGSVLVAVARAVLRKPGVIVDIKKIAAMTAAQIKVQ